MSNGFNDTNVIVVYKTLTKSPSGNYFLLDRPKYSNETYWDAQSALIVELYDGTVSPAVYHKPPQGTGWAVDGSDPTKIRVTPAWIDWAGTFELYAITLFWRIAPTQDYTGEGRLALSPQSIATQFDKAQRLAIAALEAQTRSIQRSPFDDVGETFDGRNTHAAKMTLPPLDQGRGKAIGFDVNGQARYFEVVTVDASSVEPTPGPMSRDDDGRSKVNDPVLGLEIANKQYVDLVAGGAALLVLAASREIAVVGTIGPRGFSNPGTASRTVNVHGAQTSFTWAELAVPEAAYRALAQAAGNWWDLLPFGLVFTDLGVTIHAHILKDGAVANTTPPLKWGGFTWGAALWNEAQTIPVNIFLMEV